MEVFVLTERKKVLLRLYLDGFFWHLPLRALSSL